MAKPNRMNFGKTGKDAFLAKSKRTIFDKTEEKTEKKNRRQPYDMYGFSPLITT